VKPTGNELSPSGLMTATDQEGHSHRFGRLRSPRPINRKQDVVKGGSIEIDFGSDAAPIDEREVVHESLDSSGHAIAARATQLDEATSSGQLS
jgi:hypothetical protein